MSLSELQKATTDVDEAWQQWKRVPSAKSEAAYDRAYYTWKKLGGERSVGRPSSGDQTSLTSTERAQAARARQQSSAARWEKVAPLIQALRRAVYASDSAAITSIAKSLTKETEMVLSNLQVAHALPNSDLVVINGWHGSEMVMASIPRIHLEDYFETNLSGMQANQCVDRQLDAFARIISAKYERGMHRPHSRFGSTHPRVDLTLDDLNASGEIKKTE